MPHNLFSMTFKFLEPTSNYPDQLCCLMVYVIYSMCTSQEKNKCLPSLTEQSYDQKKHEAQGELIRWTNTFLLDIFVGFIILHQVTAEGKKNKALFSSLWHQCLQSGHRGRIKELAIIYHQLNTNNANLHFTFALFPTSYYFFFIKSQMRMALGLKRKSYK